MSEFLGSRISLISKSDIRYVGVLHEINSDESTVSLENVRSFGTEGRRGRPEEEVGPSDQVYEYIVFRGSDVKDLRIEDHPGIKENQPPAMPDDPAIVGSARTRPGPPQGPNQNAPPPPGPGGPGPYGQHPYPPNNFYGPPGAWGRGAPGPGGPGGPGGPAFGNMPYPPGWFPPGQGFPPGPGGPAPWGAQPFPPGPGGPPGPDGSQQQQPPQAPGQQDKKHIPIGPGADRSNSEAPSHPPLPTEPKSLAQPSHQPVEAPTPALESKSSTEEVKAKPSETQAPSEPAKSIPTGPRTNRVNPVIPLSGSLSRPFQPPIAQEKVTQASVQATVTSTAPNSVQDATSAARAAVAAAMAQLGNGGGNAMDNLTNKVNEMRVNATRAPTAPRGRGRGGRPTGKVEVPDSDFDFAQSNAKFNKEDLLKEAIAGSPVTETGNAHTPSSTESPAPSENPIAYNKSRSFFDNISSEARERAENNGQRAGGREWRDEEQRRNMETFGQGSVDGGHRNFRGRGRGRGRGGRGRGMSRGGRGGQRLPYQSGEADL